MESLKPNHVYQLVDSPKISRVKKPAARHDVYLKVLNISGDSAHCQVFLVLKQPKDCKYYLHDKVYVPVSRLVTPALFPAYNGRPTRWKSLATEPVLQSALSILSELSPVLKTQVNILTAAVEYSDVKIGQIWKNGKSKISIDKKIDSTFVVKFQDGNIKKLSVKEVLELLNKGKMTLDKSFDQEAVLKAIGLLLLPYMGRFAINVLLGILRKFLG